MGGFLLFHYFFGQGGVGFGCGGYVVVGCGGYVMLVAEAMWFWLRRLCVGELKNKTNLSPARANLLRLSLAKVAYLSVLRWSQVLRLDQLPKIVAYLSLLSWSRNTSLGPIITIIW